MLFTRAGLQGAWIIGPEFHADNRGFFARTFCEREFAEHGLETHFVQCNISRNVLAGTLRGLHYQADPYPEPKLVRCSRGSIFDVIVDLRPDSPDYCRWMSVDLSDDNCRALYVPRGFAHGFQTLVPDAEVFYQMGEFYRPELVRGFRWDDPAFGIEWPLADPIVSDRDRSYPPFAHA